MPRTLTSSALERRVDVAGGPAGAWLLAEHVPRLDRLPQLELTPSAAIAPEPAGSGTRGGPGTSRVCERVAGAAQIVEHVLEVLRHEVRQREAIDEAGPPAHRLPPVRRAPEPGDHRAAQQELLGEAHARVRRHLEGAQLDQPQAPARAVGAVELVDADLGAVGVAGDVDQQVAEDPIDQPGRREPLRRDLRERELQLVDAVLAGLVDARRLAGRAHEHPREQVRQRRVVDEVADQAAQQIGAAQERAVRRRRRRRARRGCRRRCRCGGRRA